MVNKAGSVQTAGFIFIHLLFAQIRNRVCEIFDIA